MIQRTLMSRTIAMMRPLHLFLRIEEREQLTSGSQTLNRSAISQTTVKVDLSLKTTLWSRLINCQGSREKSWQMNPSSSCSTQSDLRCQWRETFSKRTFQKTWLGLISSREKHTRSLTLLKWFNISNPLLTQEACSQRLKESRRYHANQEKRTWSVSLVLFQLVCIQMAKRSSKEKLPSMNSH